MAVEAGQFRQAIIENTLRSCQLFVGLPREDIEAIAGFIVPKNLDKEEYLFRIADPVLGFYIVQRGAINVHRESASGKEQVIHVFRPVESFAEAALPSTDGYPANARAEQASTVLLVPKPDFLDLLRKRPELGLRMLASMSQHNRVLVSLLDDLTLKDIETRVTNWLLQRCPRPIARGEVEITLEGTKRILAAELGTTSETLSRTLAKLREAKLLRISGNKFTVKNPLELQKLLRRHLGEF